MRFQGAGGGRLGYVLMAVLFAVCCVTSSGDASARQARAAMVVDAKTGAVLHAYRANEKRFPASLTKMMTLYLVFERLHQGRLRATTQMKVSARAAGVQPSKLGLRAGQSIAVRDAIKALVTKSANDVAITVAEHIAGSEAAFARLMTRKARQLGMKGTTFANASGLPSSRQVTTARDMLRLALRLSDDFPREYRNFALRTFTYGGRRYRSHNRLLKTFRGTDGIKTGYTRAAGFNLVASVRRDNKHVLGVVFGERSASARNKRMSRLLGAALQRASVRRTRKRTRPATLFISRRLRQGPRLVHKGKTAGSRQPVVASALRPPHPRPYYRRSANLKPSQRRRGVQARPAIAPHPTPVIQPPRRSEAMTSLVRSVLRGANGPGRAPSTLQAQAAALQQQQGGSVYREHGSALRGSSSYHVQVGAYRRVKDATQQLGKVRRRAGELLRAHAPVTQRVQTAQGRMYRARFVGFDASGAGRTCSRLRGLGIDCHVARVR